MSDQVPECVEGVEAVRRFNRFYTSKIGVLEEHLLESPFSLTEARVIYELAHRRELTAGLLSEQLELDPGYLSRILRSLRERGLVERRRSASDGRQALLFLTETGEQAFGELDADSRREVGALLTGLTAEDRRRLLGAMARIERILGEPPEARAPYVLRPPEPGDLGWVVHRHGVLYAAEYGYDETFEALVARIVAEFVDGFDPRSERCWIAEREGEVTGSVFLVRDSDTVAKLRLLLVEPEARGLGIGRRLVEECLRQARRFGYQKIKLWTQDELLAARRIYERAGFELTEREPHHSFGKDLVAEVWEREL